MKISRQPGRANQKRRTRAALVQAAQGLLREGVNPTVAMAAEAALVSRATAYRYFPTQESLLVEVTTVTPSVEPVERMLRSLTGTDPRARLEALQTAFNRTTFADQAHMRTALRIYLDLWLEHRKDGPGRPIVREGRRMRWLDQALAPLAGSLAPADWRRLRAALALTMGAEAMVVMKDVCRLEDEEAQDVLRWAAGVLLGAGIETAGRRSRSRKQPGGR